MALVQPPSFLQNLATHAAINDRMAANGNMAGVSATQLRGRGGIHSGAGGKFDVQQRPSPDMFVRVKSGIAWIPGTSATTQGMYSVMNDADVDLAISASSPTLNRYDIVYLLIRDNVYAGSDNDAQLLVAAGTPQSGTPPEPSLPANSLQLARVYVGAGVTSIVTANIDEKAIWTAGLGGVIGVDSTNMPAVADYPDGQLLWQRDTAGKKFYINKTNVWTRIRTDDDAPLGEVGYDDITASTGNIIALTYTDIPGLAVTVNVVAGRKYAIHVEASLRSPSGGASGRISIREGNDSVREGHLVSMPDDIGGYAAHLHARLIAAATTARTFKVSAIRVTGSTALAMIAGSTNPAYIRVVDEGV